MDLFSEMIELCNTDFSERPISLGPWGGMGGHTWSFNEEGDGILKQIVIVYGTDTIDSISFKYEINGEMEDSIKFGGTMDSPKCTIDLDWPREYLINISGYVDKSLVSLKIVTNVKEYGPFGAENRGSPFTLPMQDGMIVGFHGRCGACLESIGVYVMKDINNIAQKKPIRIGPWGGNEGSDWIFNEEGIAAIKQIVIVHGDYIDSIAFKQELYGKTSDLVKIGGSGGSWTFTIDLDWPLEYIIDVSGYFDTKRIRSLKIVTNVKEHGPYGQEHGLPFTLSMQGGRVVGFHGRWFPFIESIGVYIKEDKSKVVHNLPVCVGPWGGKGGDKWIFNYEGNGIINQIVIGHGDTIHSIAFRSDQIHSKRFGGDRGTITDEINLEPQEYLLSISGCWGNYTPAGARTVDKVVNLLKFTSNKREYGPFGHESGAIFSLPMEGKIVGFHGSAGHYLDSIGVYMKPS